MSPPWPKHRRRWLAAIAVAGLAVGVFAACSPGRTIESIRIVDDIRAGGGPSLLKDVRPAPRRQPIVYEIDGVVQEGDLYQPGDAVKARMVLVPGVTPAGRDDPRLVDFALTLARARFEVLVPDLRNMRALRVTAEDAVPIADAVRFLDRDDDGKPLGITAVSFAAGPAVISLFDADAGERVDFVVTIGGYYDIEALITFITTGYVREQPDGPWRYLADSRLGRWVFVYSNASRLDSEDDRVTLETMAERKLKDKDADIADLIARLGPEGQAVYALLANRDPERVPALLAALPPSVRRETEALDLRRWRLEDLRPRFVMIHDRDDRVVPAGQSAAMAQALPPGRAEVFLVGSLQHADPRSPSLGDAITMLRAVYAVLAVRNRGT